MVPNVPACFSLFRLLHRKTLEPYISLWVILVTSDGNFQACILQLRDIPQSSYHFAFNPSLESSIDCEACFPTYHDTWFGVHEARNCSSLSGFCFVLYTVDHIVHSEVALGMEFLQRQELVKRNLRTWQIRWFFFFFGGPLTVEHVVLIWTDHQ